MYYTEAEARELVLKAGLELIKSGLIARTWGNISARISDDEFIITPSGLAYESLKPEELVKVKASDLSYEGNIKPSSEKGIHAIAYILRPNVNFIIHTHQFYATVVGLDGKDKEFAANTQYALSGTKKLRDNCMKSISTHSAKDAFFLHRHGALCLGSSYENAFEIAYKLENDSKNYFESVMKKEYPSINDSFSFFAAAKRKTKTLHAYIDDFAQIIGPSASLKEGKDSICQGEDSDAKEMLLDKNCAAYLYAKEKGIRPLSIVDAALQRGVYVSKYSGLKKKHDSQVR